MKIYQLSPSVYKYYIENTSRGKSCPYIVAKLKFSAMIAATSNVSDWRELGVKIYRIGRFCLVIRNGSDTISTLYWGNRNFPMDIRGRERLLKGYKELGLTEDGNNFDYEDRLSEEADCT